MAKHSGAAESHKFLSDETEAQAIRDSILKGR